MTVSVYVVHQLPRIACSAALLVYAVGLMAQTESEEHKGDENVVAPAAPEYTGPAVLSRENQPRIGQAPALVILQPFFYVNQLYGTGIVGDGNPGQAVGGIEAGFGIRGTHRWKRVDVDLNYEGNFRDYTQQTGLAGTNQYLRTTAVVQLKRHLNLALRQTVASVIQDLSSLSVQPLELSGGPPASEPYDNRATLLDSQATLTYQKSRRLSFTGSMEGSITRRASAPLVGTDEVLVGGDVAYLLSRHATVGVNYNFTHYGYATFGSANMGTIAGNLSWRLSRTVDVGMQLGMTHGVVVGLAAVPLDAEVAALVGTESGIQVSHQPFSSPILHARVSRRWRSATAHLGYQRGISPGNGLILTSYTTSVDAGFRYMFSREWNLSMRAGRTSMQSLFGSTTPTSYIGYIGDVSLSRSIRPNIQLVARFDVRPYVYSSSQIRPFYSSTIGVKFTTREWPVVLR